MIRIAAVVVGKMGGAWRDAEYVLLVVRSPLNKPRWVILSGVAWPEIDKRSKCNQLIASFPVGTIEFCCDRAVLTLPKKKHQPDLGVILTYLVSAIAQHASHLIIS